jgi:hypothetical protein
MNSNIVLLHNELKFKKAKFLLNTTSILIDFDFKNFVKAIIKSAI